MSISQTAFGSIGGVKKNTQSNYEQGIRLPDADYLSRVAEVGVDIQTVLTGIPALEVDVATGSLLGYWSILNDEHQQLLLKFARVLANG
ncbi:helix-turn-helix domain-containing protein [Shewanella sp. YLB-07]|uniref:helix-turn-helix domain-containing protein n=1 Tax=Shewanella sp. YLB-07 TaxID=2601268 RepID=UPI00128B4FFC|nr:helix-turn-helix transcriptional regulator [Shewanella sp. YLB-07]MPY24410.1 helix-turn-helix transcriptional regulator [Shewanella sp. YLB-07]